MKLINDNLNRSEIEIIKLDDPLEIFEFEFTNSFIDGQIVEENNEKLVYVTLKNPESVDLDEIYFQNGKSELYNVTFRAQIKDKSMFNSTVTMFMKFIDRNDNDAVLVAGDEVFKDGETINAIMRASAMPNSPISFEKPIQFTDSDFSKDFGIRSVNFKV